MLAYKIATPEQIRAEGNRDMQAHKDCLFRYMRQRLSQLDLPKLAEGLNEHLRTHGAVWVLVLQRDFGE